MNKQELKGAFSKIHASDELIKEVLSVGKETVLFSWRGILYAAACLMVIACMSVLVLFWQVRTKEVPSSQDFPPAVTVPLEPVASKNISFLAVNSLNLETDEVTKEPLKMQVGAPAYEGHYWGMFNSLYPGIPLFLNLDIEDFPSDQIRFEVSVDHGQFHDWNKNDLENTLGAQFFVNNDACILFRYTDEEFEMFYSSAELDAVYTKIKIYCEGNLIGYAVVRFDRAYGRDVIARYPNHSDEWAGREDVPIPAYFASLMDGAVFRKIDGQYQKVATEYVNDCIRQAIGA